MSKRILVTGAGGGGSNNLVRALEHRSELEFIGANADEWSLVRARTAKKYTVPHSADEDEYVAALNRICRDEAIDLLVPTNDTETLVTSRNRARLESKTALPSHDLIELCRDKLAFHEHCESLDIPVARTRGVEKIEDLRDVFADLKTREDSLLWCRLRVGNASKGALPVETVEQAEQWIAYWRDMRGERVEDFIVGEYLPGKDWAFQGFWVDGQLVIGKAVERLQYIFAGKTPAGRFSTPSVGKVVDVPEVAQVCLDAIAKLTPQASGIFSLDLKADDDGRPCITEINAGRFFRISPAMNLSGRYNMAESFMNWALDLGPYEIPPSARLSDVGETPTYYLCNLDEEPLLIDEGAFDDLVRMNE